MRTTDRFWVPASPLTTLAAMIMLALLVTPPGAAATPQQTDAARPTFEAMLSASGWSPTRDELEETLDRWLERFVTYIITDEERRIFEKLPSVEQKLAFTERFWDVRDPTPGTRMNEYRQEHFERWAIANRRFSAGKPGWATDRGRTFIILGAPNNLQRNPMGRGGAERGSEVWSYNMPDNPLLPGVLDLNFVDFHGTGEFELVSNLDAAAPIVSEQFGYVNNPLDVIALRRHADSIYDENFLQYRFADPTAVAREFLDFQGNLREILRIPEIHKERLAALRLATVETAVAFDATPISSSLDFYEAVAGNTSVQITLALEYDRLVAAPIGLNQHYSADMYVALEQDGQIIGESEKRLNFTLTDEELQQLGGTQILQSFQLMVANGTYDLVVLARDNTSDRVTRTVDAIDVPNLSSTGLRLSSLTLASRIEPVQPGAADAPLDFQHGDMRVVPNVNRVYFLDQQLLLYVQAYGLGIDDATHTNRVTIRGEILQNGERVRRIPEQHPFPAPMNRQSFSFGMPLNGYRPGVYEVVLEIVDEIAATSSSVTTDFAILPTAARTDRR